MRVERPSECALRMHFEFTRAFVCLPSHSHMPSVSHRTNVRSHHYMIREAGFRSMHEHHGRCLLPEDTPQVKSARSYDTLNWHTAPLGIICEPTDTTQTHAWTNTSARNAVVPSRVYFGSDRPVAPTQRTRKYNAHAQMATRKYM
jgi:hypothetical protein